MRLVLAVLLVLTSPLAYAIQVDGEGRTLEQALNNAFKVAIDNEVGVILDTERHLKNGKVTHNQILSYSAGYITSYTILHHIHIRDMDIHQVTVDVTVASSKLKNFLLSSNHNPHFFDVDNIKAQIRLYKKGQIDGHKLVENTLKYFPHNAMNIVTHDFDVVVDYHNPRKFYLQIPYTIYWNQKYLVALEELITLFASERSVANPMFVQFDDEYLFIHDAIIMRSIKKTLGRRDFVSLTINSLQNQISINTCVQSILSKPGESWSNSRALYSHIGKGVKIISDRSVDSFILYPINESKLEDFRGLTEITLSVSSAKNCPENS